MKKSIWPESLVRDIGRRRAVFVIGSGVSRHATTKDGNRPPLWKEFLIDAANHIGRKDDTEHIFKAIDEGDLLHACEWIKDNLDERWSDYLRSKFVNPKYNPGKVHETIARLDTRVVFTLNFDDIYENKSREVNETSQFIKNYSDEDICEFLRGDARYIIKVHGSLSSPANMIFTQEEYAKARIKNSLFYKAFDSALMTHSFLFIGCGYGDPDLNLLLENQAFSAVPGSLSPHYFLTSEEMPLALSESLRKNRNLKTVRYKKTDDIHSGLTNALQELLDLVSEARVDLVESNNW